MRKTVKARTHHGADSLDITIPTRLVEELDISAGDVFEVSVEQDGEGIRLVYERVYEK